MILKWAVLSLTPVHDSMVLKGQHSSTQPTKGFYSLWGRGGPPLHLTWALLHLGQSSLLKKSAEAFTTGGGNSWKGLSWS